jgi:hypothetical protein
MMKFVSEKERIRKKNNKDKISRCRYIQKSAIDDTYSSLDKNSNITVKD